MAIRRRYAQCSKIWQPPHLAVDERIAHRPFADADRHAAVALAGDDEAMQPAQAEIGGEGIALALERQPHPAPDRVRAQLRPDVRLVLPVRVSEDGTAGHQAS